MSVAVGPVVAREVGDRPGHPQHPVQAPGGEQSRAPGPAPPRPAPRAPPASGCAAHGRAPRCWSSTACPRSRAAARSLASRTRVGDRGRRLAPAALLQQIGPVDRLDLDPQVDPVEQRAGEPRLVAADRRGRALAAARRCRECRPQGQGLAASTIRNRAGSRTTPAPRATTTWPDSRGWRRASSALPAELRGLVQEEHPSVRQRDRARPRQPVAPADQGLHGRRVVRGAVRRPVDQRFARRQDARHRVDRRDLQGLLPGQRRQDRRAAARPASSCPRPAGLRGQQVVSARPPRPPGPCAAAAARRRRPGPGCAPSPRAEAGASPVPRPVPGHHEPGEHRVRAAPVVAGPRRAPVRR